MNNILPLVSIICTSYNHEKYIAQALDGFVMQKSTFPFEIIVHDDASTDNTVAIIREYEAKYQHMFVTIYQTENQFSKGSVSIWSDITFPLARGKYIALCEGDDYWTDPYKLQKQVDFLEKNDDYVICHHDAIIIDELDNVVNSSKLPDSLKRDLSADDLIKANLILTLTVCFRNVIRELPYEYYRVFNKDTFLFSMIGNYGKAKYLGGEITSDAYRKHAGGVWSSLDYWQRSYHSTITVYWLSRYYKRIGMKQYAEYFAMLYQSYFFKLLKQSFHAKKYRHLFRLCGLYFQCLKVLLERWSRPCRMRGCSWLERVLF